MKNNSFISLLINPFHKIAGWSAFVIGLMIVTVTIVVGQINGIVYDGVFDIHFANVPLPYAFSVQLCSLLILILLLFTAGKIFSSSKIRFIDVAGTTLMARTPFLLVSLIGFLPYCKHLNENLTSSIKAFDSAAIDFGLLLPFIFISGVVLVWFVWLSYSAFSTSCNLKGSKGIILFLSSLFIAEALSVIFNQFILKKYLFASLCVLAPGNQAEANDINYEEINKISVEVTECFTNKKYDELTTYFNDEMKNAMTASQLENVVRSLEQQVGEITFNTNQIKNNTAKNHRLVLIPIKTNKVNLHLQLAFDDKDKISGMYFK